MTRAYSSLVRTSAFVRKEYAEVVRQPRLLLTLVIGPFLILLIFGAGLRDVDPPFQTVFVAPEEDELAAEVREFADEQRARLTVEGVTEDEQGALRRLRRGALDMVVVFPDDVEESIRANEHAVIRLYHNQADPIEGRAIALYLQHAIAEINRQVVASAIEEGQADSQELEERVAEARERVTDAREAMDDADDARAVVELARLRADTAALVLAAGPATGVIAGAGGGEAGDDDSVHAAVARFNERMEAIEDPDDFAAEVADLDQDLALMEGAIDEFRSVSPEVLAAPFRGEVRRLAGNDVELGDFYAPAVVVVLLQHMLVTFVGLSLVREMELGTTELYRVAPLRTSELLLGKYLAYMLMSALVSAVLLGALVIGLGVPMQGSWGFLALALLAVVLSSCGLGLCVAALARGATQAVQYTMLVLLVTVFFSGFLLSLDRFIPPFHWVGYLVPATYGIDLLRTTMLHGLAAPWPLAALGLFAVLLGVVGAIGVDLRLRRG